MIEDIFETIKGIMLKPINTFQKIRDESFQSAIIYFIVLAIVWSILLISFVEYQYRFLFNSIVVTLLLKTIINFIILIIIGALILHIFVYIFGGKKGLKQTIKAVLYSYTPFLILGWMPFLMIIGMIWTFVLGILAIREFQEIPTVKAVIAIIISIVASSAFSLVAAMLYETILFMNPLLL